MSTVTELIDVFGQDASGVGLQRCEELLLAHPLPGMGPQREHPLLQAAHFPPGFEVQPFSPPRGVVENPFLRVEWQTMAGRQPFYHRNCGVDEIAYQVDGERTLMTELGTVDLLPGDFVRLPDGVAHDNLGRRDVHLLFYVPGPARELQAAARESELRMPPFRGWEPATVNELITHGVGGPGQDVVMSPADEQLLLEHARRDTRRLGVLNPGGGAGTTWLYRAPDVLLGQVVSQHSDGAHYVRHRDADELQYQVAGTRMLVTQRGCLQLVAGDFVCIPKAVAFTSIHGGPSTHLALLSTRPLALVAAHKSARRLTPDDLRDLRAHA